MRAGVLRRACAEVVAQAQVVHAGVGNIYQPYPLFGFNAAVKRSVTTVFVMDGDVITRITDGAVKASPLKRLEAALVCGAYARSARRAVNRASVSLLKGRLLHERYARSARNPRNFYDTSYATSDIIEGQQLNEKRAEVLAGEPLRCVTVGRLMSFKHIDHTLEAFAIARPRLRGATLDLLGGGPEETRLRQIVERLGLEDVVRFLGSMQYGPELLRKLRTYHVQVFSSIIEETPRALFDGIASGCALLSYGIPFTQELTEIFRHGVAAPVGDVRALADAWVGMDLERSRTAEWIAAAASAAPQHTAESWYARRAEWTIEAYERDQASKRRK